MPQKATVESDLGSLTVSKLRALAREVGLAGASRLRKADLVKAIAARRAEVGAASEPSARTPTSVPDGEELIVIVDEPPPPETTKPSRAVRPVPAAPARASAEPPAKPPSKAATSARVAPVTDAAAAGKKAARATSSAPRAERPIAAGFKGKTAAARPAVLTFVPVGPRRLFACWDVDPVSVDSAREALADAAAVVTVRVHDRTLIEFDDRRSHAHFDTGVFSASGNYYFNDLFPGRSYQAELGVLSSDGRFRVIAISPVIETPRERATACQEPRIAVVAGEAPSRWGARAASFGAGGVPVADASVDLGRGRSESGAARAASDELVHEPAIYGAAAVAEDARNGNGNGSNGAGATVEAPWWAGPAVDLPFASAAPDIGTDDPGTVPEWSTALAPGAPEAAHGESESDATLGGPVSSASFLDLALPSSFDLARGPGEESIGGVSSLGLLPLVERAGPMSADEAVEDEGRRLTLELHADLIVYGRADPETTVVIDGVRVPVREDGTFDIRFALGNPKSLGGDR